MLHLYMEECSINEVFSGIYKITFPNGKIYIGKSNHIYRRMLEHNCDFRNNLPIEHAILKYGKITEFDILEEIPVEDAQRLNEREKYWIQFYNSTDKNIGYNISLGGDGAGVGSLNHEAKLTEEELLQLYKELKENLDVSLQDLANKYNLDISSLSRINNGHSYYHSNIKYPIRDSKACKKIISGVKNSNSTFTQSQLEEIYELLKNELDLSMAKIAERYNVSPSVIQDINTGNTYINEAFSYPLRKPKTGARKLTDEQALKIIQEIKLNPSESLSSISRRLQASAKTVSAINCGTIYKQPNETYPIRIKKINNAVSTIRGSAE